MKEEWKFKGKMVRVVDGDTLDFDVDLGFNITHRIRVRLLGVDTPEVYGVKHSSEEYAKGVKASEATAAWFDVEPTQDSEYYHIITTQDTGKYGRYLAEVETLDGNYNLNDFLREYLKRQNDD